MKILVIHQNFLEKDEPGGSRFNELTRFWAEKGHQITVLAGMVHYNTGIKNKRYKGKFTFTDNYAPNITVIRCHVSEAFNVNFIGRLWAYFSFVFSSIYGGLFKTKGKFDIILVTSPPLFVGITAYVLSLFKRLPYVLEIRDLWPESAIDTGVLTNKFIIKWAYNVENFLYRHAVLINVLTPAFRTTLIEKKQIPEAKIVYIPNAADFSISENLLNNFDTKLFRQQLGWENKFVIIYVGAHGVANHLIQVLNTAEILKAKRRNDVHFVLIGEGMEKKKLQELTIEKKLNNVEFFPSVAKYEVFKYILASDVGSSVLKKVDTFKTVFSNKTFDYMACKKIIFMLIDGVSRELIETARCGIYVEPENANEYAEKIIHYIDHKDTYAISGENGYHYAWKNFDREVLANKYIDILESVIK